MTGVWTAPLLLPSRNRMGAMFVYTKAPAQAQAVLTRGRAWAHEVELLQEKREA